MDGEKAFTWVEYLAAVRSRSRCLTVLVVFTTDRRVAEWANAPVDLGPCIGPLRPIVIGPDQIPPLVDRASARASPELATLAALAHGQDEDAERAAEVASAATDAVLAMGGDRGLLYYDLIRAALSEAARRAFDMLSKGYEYQDEGLRRAKAEGKSEGKSEGKAEGKAETLLKLLAARGLTLTATQEALIHATSDPDLLDRWILASVSAESVRSAIGHP